MSNPTPEQCREVASVFRDLIDNPTFGTKWVDMGAGIHTNDCGTVACHAGWYLLGRSGHVSDAGWADGADMIAKDLGFQDREELENWAGRNPGLWGNSNGFRMFYNPRAFMIDGYLELHRIANHWDEVASRIEEATP